MRPLKVLFRKTTWCCVVSRICIYSPRWIERAFDNPLLRIFLSIQMFGQTYFEIIWRLTLRHHDIFLALKKVDFCAKKHQKVLANLFMSNCHLTLVINTTTVIITTTTTNTTTIMIIILSCDATGGVGSDRQFHVGSDLVSIAMNKKTL